MADFETLKEAMKKGRVPEVCTAIQALLAEKVTASDILKLGLLTAMDEIGQKFKRNEIFVPTVLLAARAMKKGTELLKPLLVQAGVEPFATAVIGTVKGDLHDIGKNLVGMMLEGVGFRVIDAGVSVPPEKFVSLARENQARIIGIAALLTTTMPGMKVVIDQVHAANLPVKVLIGGAPVTQAFADSIGADAYCPDAATAAETAKRMAGN